MPVIQIKTGGFDNNFSYIALDGDSRDAAIVDPCGSVEKIRAVLEKIGIYTPKYILITHSHPDHISGSKM